jgi:hypothetical protein
MSSAPECVFRFQREDLFAASPERMARALRQQVPGSWPASPIGGGAASPHVSLVHLGKFMIAQAGFVPSGAANALAVFRDFPLFPGRYTKDYVRGWDEKHPRQAASYEERHPPPPALTLHEFVEITIDAASDPTKRDAMTHWELTMCITDPAWATLDFGIGGYHYRAEFRRFPSPWTNPRDEHVETVVRIPRRALMICGELWADSKAKLAARDENAATLPGATASSTALTARKRQQHPNSADVNARVRASATSTGGPHARNRRSSSVRNIAGTS